MTSIKELPSVQDYMLKLLAYHLLLAAIISSPSFFASTVD